MSKDKDPDFNILKSILIKIMILQPVLWLFSFDYSILYLRYFIHDYPLC